MPNVFILPESCPRRDMAYRINMPKLEQGMQQGILIAWLVDVNEEVSEGEPIAEIVCV